MNETLSIEQDIQRQDLEEKLRETTSLKDDQIKEIVPVILSSISEIQELEKQRTESTTKENLLELNQSITNNSNVSIDMKTNKGTVIGTMNFNEITNNINITINLSPKEPTSTVSEIHSTDTESTVSEVHNIDTQSTVSEVHNIDTQSTVSEVHNIDTQSTVSEVHNTDTESTVSEVHNIDNNPSVDNKIDIYTIDGFISVLNKLLEEIEDTKTGISKTGLSKAGKETMKLAKAKLKQYKNTIKAKKEKLEKAIKKGTTPQIYETDVQQVINLKSNIDEVRKSVSLGQWGELSNLGSFLYNSPENARKANHQQERLNQFENMFKQEVKDGAILNIFNKQEQAAIDYYRRIAEGNYNQVDYALYTMHTEIFNPSFQRCGIPIPLLAPNLMLGGTPLETGHQTTNVPRKSIDYRNLERGDAFEQGGLAGVIDKALSNCNNLTPGQRNTWKNIAVLGGYAAGIYGLYKFFTNKKMGFWGKALTTGGVIFGSQLLTGENPISLFQKLMTGGFSKDELESRFGNAFGDAVNGIGNSGIESAATIAPAMYSMMIFNPKTTVGDIQTMTNQFKTDNNAWKTFRGDAITTLKNRYGERCTEHFSTTFSDNFDEQKRKEWLSSFGVTDSTNYNTCIYEIANNASMNEIILLKFKEENGLKETSNEAKKKELHDYIKNLKDTNQALNIAILEQHPEWFELDKNATYTERPEDTQNKKKLEDQVEALSIDSQKKAELKAAVKRFYDERTIESKPNLDKFNLKMEGDFLILNSHGGYETKINLNNKSLDKFGNGDGITFTNLSDLLNAADLTNKILESQKGKMAVDIPPFKYKIGRGIYFNNARGVRDDLISFNWSGTDTRVLSSGLWGASKKIDEIDNHLEDYAKYLSERRKEINIPSST